MAVLRCKKCDAEIYWSEKDQSLKCDYCGSFYKPEDYGQEDNIKRAKKYERNDNNLINYQCSNCGAHFITTGTGLAETCNYCGSALVMDPGYKRVNPDVIIPFVVNREQAKNALRAYFKRSKFLPLMFKSDKIFDDMKGMFIPYYLFSFTEHIDASCDCGKILKRYDKSDIVKVHRFLCDVEFHTRYTRLPIEALKDFDDVIGASIEPFNYKKLVPFHPGYLAGYYADVHDDKIDDVRNSMYDKTRLITHNALKSELHCHILKTDRKYNSRFEDVKMESALIPVWVLKIKHGGQTYTYAVNGTTGEVAGRIPKNSKVLKGIFGGAAAITFGIPLLIALFESGVRFTFGDFVISALLLLFLFIKISNKLPKDQIHETKVVNYLDRSEKDSGVVIDLCNTVDLGIQKGTIEQLF